MSGLPLCRGGGGTVVDCICTCTFLHQDHAPFVSMGTSWYTFTCPFKDHPSCRLLLSSFCNGRSFRTLGLMLEKKQSPPAG